MFRHAALMSVVLCTAAAAPLSAQSVVARVLDDETSQPVAGALAYLVEAGGGSISNTLTDGAGRAYFGGVPEGEYTVRVEMIGRETAESDGFLVEEGLSLQVDIMLASRAIALEGIEVSALERCRVRPEEGLAISRVWNEARKALAAASYTDRSDLYRYRTERYDRDLGREARRVRSEERSEQEAFLRIPFQSRPADDLVANGFVQDGPDGGLLYFAPDASVLLSDVFLDSHCFRLREGAGDAEGLIGISFEPAAGRSRRIPDIAGTFWLDPATAELQWLEYQYENLFPEIRTELMGGRVEFQRLPDGTWIVPEWWIRMPLVVQEPTTAGRQRIRIDGYRQTGGRVVEIADSDADFLRQQDSLGGIEGFVQDSLGTNPMSGVRVHLVGTDHEARTDAEGKFRLDGLEAGTYQISFGAPYTAAFGLRPEPLEREVFDGEVTAVLYRMPPVSDLLFEACRDERPPEGTGALMGRVVRRDASEPVAGIPVKVRWQEVTLTGGGGRVAGTRVLGFETETEEDGSYRFCSVPEDTQLSVFVELDGRDTEPDLVRLPQFSRGVAHTIVLP